MHNEHKFITQGEKIDVKSSRDLEASGNLMKCFHAIVNGVRTRFRVAGVVFILVFRITDPASVVKSLLQGDKIICLIKQGLYL